MKTNSRRGIVLVLVLVVVAMLAMACLGFTELMLNERKAAQMAARQSQTRTLAQSGVELARQFLDRDPTDQTAAGGLYDNSQRFNGVVIADDTSPRDRGCCSVIAPRFGDQTIVGVRYGLQDESARINLATILQFDKQSAGGASQSGTGGTGTGGTGTGGTGTSGSGTSGSGTSGSGTGGSGTGGSGTGTGGTGPTITTAAGQTGTDAAK